MDTLLSRHWHHLPRDEIATLLESDAAKGLDMFEVVHRQSHFGPNRLTLKKGKSPLAIISAAIQPAAGLYPAGCVGDHLCPAGVGR